MNCTASPALDELELLAYLDGEADERVVQHLEQCAHCRARAKELYRVERRLTARLYRAGCPSALELGEYRLGVLDRERAAAVSLHLGECPHCTGELARLSDFLGDLAPEPAVSRVDLVTRRVKVLIASLVDQIPGPGLSQPPVLAPAYAGVRGSESQPYVYEAGDIQVVIEVQPDTGQPDRRAVLGLVMGTDPRDMTAGMWQEDQLIATVGVDEIGNFVIPGLAPGSYRLILSAPEVEVRIEDLTLAGS